MEKVKEDMVEAIKELGFSLSDAKSISEAVLETLGQSNNDDVYDLIALYQ